MSEPKVREFKSQEERDEYLEASYHYDRKGYRSTTSYVAGEWRELVRAFHASWDPAHEDMRGALIRFEVSVFGAALETGAHGMLLFRVKESMKHGVPEARKAKCPPRLPNEPALVYVARIAEVNGWIKPGTEAVRDMPPVPEELSA